MTSRSTVGQQSITFQSMHMIRLALSRPTVDQVMTECRPSVNRDVGGGYCVNIQLWLLLVHMIQRVDNPNLNIQTY